jgi:hypothetical protein
VPQHGIVPAGRIAAGVPARLLDRVADDDYRAAWLGFKQIYAELCDRYRAGYSDETPPDGSRAKTPRAGE